MTSRELRKEKFIQLLGGKCINCGATDDLQFDHLNTEDKVFTIAPHLNRKEEDLLPEVMKCQLLCPQCHRDKTKSSWDYALPPSQHGTIWFYKNKKCRCSECREAMSQYYFKRKEL